MYAFFYKIPILDIWKALELLIKKYLPKDEYCMFLLSSWLLHKIKQHTFIHVCICELLSHIQLPATPWTVACKLLCPWDFPSKNAGVGCHFLLQCVCIVLDKVFICCWFMLKVTGLVYVSPEVTWGSIWAQVVYLGVASGDVQ